MGINFFIAIYIKNKGKDISNWQWQPHSLIMVGTLAREGSRKETRETVQKKEEKKHIP